jgi:GT2 family glycosyltransferase
LNPLNLGKDVTIATAAYGNAAVTRLCLQSILRSAVGDYELLLIDDCSPDSAAIRALYLEAKQQHPNTRIMSFSENLEYTGSVNAVLSHAAGERIFFISNDIFVTPIYLNALLETARQDARIGILRGSSNFVDNFLPSHNLTLAKPPNNFEELCVAGAEIAEAYGYTVQKDPYLVGDAFLVKRAVIDRIGTFDPWFYGYFGDPDFALRARIAGFELALVPGAFAYHLRSANFDYLPEQERTAKVERRWMRVYENWARFKLKYGLPVSMAYTNIGTLPWDEMAAVPFSADRHYSPPGDYARFLI